MLSENHVCENVIIISTNIHESKKIKNVFTSLSSGIYALKYFHKNGS